MSNEIATQDVVTKDILGDYLKTITANLSDTQRLQFCSVAQSLNLNPFKREIYATTYKDKDGKTNMSIVVGYEVYLKRAERNPAFDGYDVEFGKDGNELYCTCVVYRKDRNHPTKSKVYMSDYSTGRSLWQSKPRVMLEKVAICTAFRRAFPTDFGGFPYEECELPNQPSTSDVATSYKAVEERPAIPTEKPQDKAIDAEVVNDTTETKKSRKTAATPEEKKAAFVSMCQIFVDENPSLVKMVLQNNGFDSLESVTEENYRTIYNLIKNACTGERN